MAFCTKCGALLEEGSGICGKCGGKAEQKAREARCGFCGNLIKEGLHYCSYCGADLSESPPAKRDAPAVRGGNAGVQDATAAGHFSRSAFRAGAGALPARDGLLDQRDGLPDRDPGHLHASPPVYPRETLSDRQAAGSAGRTDHGGAHGEYHACHSGRYAGTYSQRYGLYFWIRRGQCR